MKKLLIVIFLMISTFAYAQNTSLKTGRNNLPVSMDMLKEFSYAGDVEYIELWVFYEEGISEDYSKYLLADGYKQRDNEYVKGNNICYISDDVISFTVNNIKRPVRKPAEIMALFPPFNMADYGSMYAVDIDIKYQKAVPQKTIERYIDALKAVGFAYDTEFEEYGLDVEQTNYYFQIDAPDTLVWGVLYY